MKKRVKREMKAASAVDIVASIICAREERALIVVVGVLVGDRVLIGACAEEDWQEKRMGGDLFCSGRRGNG